MTQYAYYDPGVPAPSPIIGWYDTTVFHYPHLPSPLIQMTPDQWAARTDGHWAVQDGALVPYTPPPPSLTLGQQANAAMANGLVVTSRSNPALNGSYAVDGVTTTHIQAEVLALVVSGAFADGTDSVAWPDVDDVTHDFSADEFQAFALAVGSYVARLYRCINGTLPALPASAVTIP